MGDQLIPDEARFREVLIDIGGEPDFELEEKREEHNFYSKAVAFDLHVWLLIKLFIALFVYFQSLTNENMLLKFLLFIISYHILYIILYTYGAYRYSRFFSAVEAGVLICYCFGEIMWKVGWAFYIRGFIELYSVKFFTLPLIVASIVGIYMGCVEKGSTWYALLRFFEAVQLFLLPLMAQSSKKGEQWNWGLWYFKLFIFGQVALYILVLLVVSAQAIGYFVSGERVSRFDRLRFVAIFSFFPIILAEFCSNLYVFQIVARIFHCKLFSPTIKLDEDEIDYLLISKLMVLTYGVLILFTAAIYSFLIRRLVRNLTEPVIKKIKVEYLSTPLESGYKQVSETFYQKLEKNNLKKSIHKLDTCVICLNRQANVIVNPCGHGATCEECMVTFFKTSDCCPLCKMTVERVDVVFRDPKTRMLMTTGHIRFSF